MIAIVARMACGHSTNLPDSHYKARLPWAAGGDMRVNVAGAGAQNPWLTVQLLACLIGGPSSLW